MNTQQMSPELRDWFQTTKGYKIHEKVGQGLQCTVYRMNKLGKQQFKDSLALKLTKPQNNLQSDKQMQKKNKRSILKLQLQSLLFSQALYSHPGIIRCKQSGNSCQFGFLVVEYLSNGNLKQLYNQYLGDTQQSQSNKIPKQIQQKCSKHILAQLLTILKNFSDTKLVHRDIKMENIMFDENYHIKVIDYSMMIYEKQELQNNTNIHNNGILQQKKVDKQKQQQQQLLWDSFGLFNGSAYQLSQYLHNNSSMISGSKLYLTPEAIAPKKHRIPITSKADIWAFGIIAYKLFYKKFPISNSGQLTTYQLFSKIRQQEPEYPKIQDFGEDLRAIQQTKIQLVKGCLSKDCKTRSTIEQLMKLPYFAGINFEKDDDDNQSEYIYERFNPLYRYLHPQKFTLQWMWFSDKTINTKFILKKLQNPMNEIDQNNSIRNRFIKNRYIGYHVGIRQNYDGHHWFQFVQSQQFKNIKKNNKNRNKNVNKIKKVDHQNIQVQQNLSQLQNNQKNSYKSIIKIRCKYCYPHKQIENKKVISVQIFEDGQKYNIEAIQLVFNDDQIKDQFMTAINAFRR